MIHQMQLIVCNLGCGVHAEVEMAWSRHPQEEAEDIRHHVSDADPELQGYGLDSDAAKYSESWRFDDLFPEGSSSVRLLHLLR